MPAIFCDIDGTIMHWGTETPLPGAIEKLTEFTRRGGQIIFTTQRQEYDTNFDMENLRRLLHKYFPGAPILYGISSPRIVINDAGAFAINHPRNSPWTNYNFDNPNWWAE